MFVARGSTNFLCEHEEKSSCMSVYFNVVFSPKDDNLGELMSTVCGCMCEGGQVWVHARRRGVGDRPDPAGGRLGVD